MLEVRVSRIATDLYHVPVPGRVNRLSLSLRQRNDRGVHVRIGVVICADRRRSVSSQPDVPGPKQTLGLVRVGPDP